MRQVHKVVTIVVVHPHTKEINLRMEVVVVPIMVHHDHRKVIPIAHVVPITTLKKIVNNNHYEQTWKKIHRLARFYF